MAPGDPYPRTLRPKEVDLLEGVLPPDRPGYQRYRELIHAMVVLGEGNQGPGNYLLGYLGATPDHSMPLSPVIAFGVVEATSGSYAVTIREFAGGQIEVEIVSGPEGVVPDHFEEKRRWTYSTWLPGQPSPATGGAVREVAIDPFLTLAIAPKEKRIWLYDRASGINLLLPVTNFHNELMLCKGIRDPKIALDVGMFFGGHADYSDADLREAFIRYNAFKLHVNLQQAPPVPSAGGFFQAVKRLFVKEKR